MAGNLWTAVGLMSGTSMDGVDAAVIATDGEALVEAGPWLTVPYDDSFRTMLRGLLAGRGDSRAVEQALTLRHAQAVTALLDIAKLSPSAVDVIGFHGHTIRHEPERRRTWQLGDGPDLASELGIDVVYDFRSADVSGGGQGAPLAPAFHRALTAEQGKPLAILNIGGVANITWVGAGTDDLVAFDTGPGNALLDDWVSRHTGGRFDAGGKIAASGRAHPDRLAALLADPYFFAAAPKSLDRNAFSESAARALAGLSLPDGAALLTALTVESVARAVDHLPSQPARWIVVGGGRHNPSIMNGLAQRLAAEVASGDHIGWDGDAVEAQAFAYLAVRSRLGLPISFPGTTGVATAMTGGRYAPAA